MRLRSDDRGNRAIPRHVLSRICCRGYPRGNVSVPAPDKEQLHAIHLSLVERTKSAEVALQVPEPTAHIGPEACLQCDVRHLCSDYWVATSRRTLRAACNGDFDDVELQVQKRVGEYSWLCNCSVATHLPAGSTILLRAEGEAAAFAKVFETGARFRVVGTLISRTDDETLAVASIVGSSELFRVPPEYP